MELLYVWVKEHRNIKNQGFNFNNNFKIVVQVGRGRVYATIESSHLESLPNFFGNNITSVTTIVGENGVGKSSICKLIADINKAYTNAPYEQLRKNTQGSENEYHIFSPPKEKNIIAVAVYAEGNNFVICIFNKDRNYKQIAKLYTINKKIVRHEQIKANKYIYLTNTRATFLPNNEALDTDIKMIENVGKFIGSSALELSYGVSNISKEKFPTDILAKLSKNLLDGLDRITVNFTSQPFFKTIIDGRNTKWKDLSNPISSILLAFPYENHIPNFFEYIITMLCLPFLNTLPLKEHLINDDAKIEVICKNLNDYKKQFASYKEKNTPIDTLILSFYDALGINKDNYKDLYDYIKFFLDVLKYTKVTAGKSSELIINGFESKESFDEFKKFIENPITIKLIDEKLLSISYGNDSNSSGTQTVIRTISVLYNIINQNKQHNQHYILILDEIDTTLHPEWQRLIFSIIVDILSFFSNNTFQLIFTTHSPFLLSDIPSGNVIFLKKDATGNCQVVDNALQDNRKTFAANIHSLLADGFFMQNGLIGEFAKGKINEVIDLLNKDDNTALSADEQTKVQTIINMIGEPIIRHKLTQLYNEKMQFNTDKSLKNHDERIKDLENKIKQLEDKIANNNNPTE